MKKQLISWALALVCVSAFPYQAFGNDDYNNNLGLSLEVGADVVSSYLWRGQNLGGISIQPSLTFGWRGLYASAWGNIGAYNWTFEELNPELDITIGYDNYGVQVDLTHLYYFNDEPYFPKGGFQNNVSPDDLSTTMEAHVGFHLGDLIEKVPLSLDWYTTIYGADCYQDENDEWKRAWSTYIQVGYTFNLPLGIDLQTNIGFTPWLGMYSGYEEVWKNAKTVAINNIHLRAERYFELKDIELGLWAECMLNCYGIDKTNLTTELTDKENQRLNLGIGGCLYFSTEW